MEPVVRLDHNFVYEGGSDAVGDLACRRENGEVYSHWELTPNELAQLTHGDAHIELGIFAEPIPPVSLRVVQAKPPPGMNGKVVYLDDRRR